jgi:hypothetical protein
MPKHFRMSIHSLSPDLGPAWANLGLGCNGVEHILALVAATDMEEEIRQGGALPPRRQLPRCAFHDPW